MNSAVVDWVVKDMCDETKAKKKSNRLQENKEPTRHGYVSSIRISMPEITGVKYWLLCLSRDATKKIHLPPLWLLRSHSQAKCQIRCYHRMTRYHWILLTAIAAASPPPLHTVAMPIWSFCNACRSVTTIRAPDALQLVYILAKNEKFFQITVINVETCIQLDTIV